jgi:hypothetical protein
MPSPNINTGAGGDTVAGGFDKTNAHFNDTTEHRSQEAIEDIAAGLLNHANHTNITANYNDAANRVELTGTAGGGGSEISGGFLYYPIPLLMAGSGQTLGTAATLHEFQTSTSGQRRFVNLTGVSEIALEAGITTLVAGGELGVQYSLDSGTNWKNFDAPGTLNPTTIGAPKLSLAAVANPLASAFMAVPAEAQTEVMARIVAISNGTINPAAVNIQIKAKYGMPSSRMNVIGGVDGAISAPFVGTPRMLGWRGNIDTVITHLGNRSTSGDFIVGIYYLGLANTVPGTPDRTVTIPASAGGTGGGVESAITPIVVGDRRAQVAVGATQVGSGAQSLEVVLQGYGV